MFTISRKGYRDEIITEPNWFTIIPTIIVGLFIFITIISGFYVVQPGQVAFEKTFGKIDNRLHTEGLYFKMPWFTQAIKTNIRNIVITTKETAASMDAQDVTTELAVNFSILPGSAIELYSTVGSESTITDKIVRKAIQESIKAASAKFTATETITKRTELRDEMIKNLNTKLEPRGLVINQVDILDLSFSKSFNDAIEAKVKAEQDALKAKALVEKVKYEAESKIAKTQGESDSAIIRAEGAAKAVEINAIAEAEAIAIKAKAIQVQGGEDYIKLQWINTWNGVLPTTSLGTDTNILMNLK